jgi:hypothetical protein
MNHLPGPSGTEHQIVRSSSGSTVFQRAAALGSRNSSSSSNPGARVQRFARPTIFANRSRRNERQPKPVTYSRDIFCLLPEFRGRSGTVIIPRGSRRSALADERSGLLGKIIFQSDWSEERTVEEITRVFAMPFGLSTEDILAGKRVEFSYLQRTGAGARSLCLPVVTSDFKWSGRQVSTLAKSGGVIYILSAHEIPVVRNVFRS